MITKVLEAFNLPEDEKIVEEFFSANLLLIDEFLAGKNANGGHIIFFFDKRRENGVVAPLELQVSLVADPNMSDKVAYFLRESDKPINLKFQQDTTLSYGEVVQTGLLALLKSTVEKVYAPIFREKEDWGKVTDPKEKADFLDQTDDFVKMLESQLENLKGEVELKLPAHDFEQYDLKPATYQKLVQVKEIVEVCKGF